MAEPKITGKAIHKTYKQIEPTVLSWSQISNKGRERYGLIADQLNQQFLEPLQGLVRDYQSLVREALLVESNSDLREWQNRKSALEAQAKELLGEGEAN